jgi:hypothetical protein
MTAGRPTERWDARQDGTFRRAGRPPLTQVWVPGRAKPSTQNTGPVTPEVNLKNYAGSFTNAQPGDTIQGLIVERGIVLNQTGVKVRDTLILNTPPPGYVPTQPGDPLKVLLGIHALTAGVSDLVVEDVAIRTPVGSRNYDQYGVQGRNIVLRRTEITGVVDAVVAHGTTTQQGTLDAEGCYLHGLTRFLDDPRQTDGSHSDGIQAEGALSRLRVVGNTILGGYTSAILITQNVAHPDDYGEVTVTDNWLDMEVDGGAVVNLAEKGRGAVANYTLARNRFGRRYLATAPRILTDTATKNASTTYMPTTGPDANVYEDNGAPVTLGFASMTED